MTDVNTVASIIWSVGGLVAGYGIGYYHRSVKGRRATPMATPPTPTPRREGPGAATRPTRGSWREKGIGQTILGLLILALIAGTMVGLYRTTACQAGYNAAVTRSIAARSAQSNEQLDRQIEQLDAQLDLLAPYDQNAPIDQQRAEGLRRTGSYRQAAAANREALVKLRDTRTANPTPAADSCGEVKR